MIGSNPKPPSQKKTTYAKAVKSVKIAAPALMVFASPAVSGAIVIGQLMMDQRKEKIDFIDGQIDGEDKLWLVSIGKKDKKYIMRVGPSGLKFVEYSTKVEEYSFLWRDILRVAVFGKNMEIFPAAAGKVLLNSDLVIQIEQEVALYMRRQAQKGKKEKKKKNTSDSNSESESSPKMEKSEKNPNSISVKSAAPNQGRSKNIPRTMSAQTSPVKKRVQAPPKSARGRDEPKISPPPPKSARSGRDETIIELDD